MRAFLAGDDAYPLLGDDPRSHDGQKAFSVTAVPSEEDPDGYLYVVLLGERVDTIAALLHTSFIARYSGLALIVSIVVGSLAGLVVLHAMTRRLRRLTNHIDRFRAGEFRTFEPFATSGPGDGDEIAQLGRAYDEMAARIGQQLDALEKTDALRREMVAHVSHDLRTPLATLHGYIETLILKDAELDPAERERYLAVALDQSERLRRLVGDLFELAKLDAHEQMPACEPVSLAELVSDIAQKFQLEAQRRGSTIAIDAGEGLPMVDADIALVERVLENLIDNALSHSPEGGAIRIPIASNGGAVRVTVSDSGPGIAPEHLPRGFDRFYQGRERASGQRPRRARPGDRETHRGAPRCPTRGAEHPGAMAPRSAFSSPHTRRPSRPPLADGRASINVEPSLHIFTLVCTMVERRMGVAGQSGSAEVGQQSKRLTCALGGYFADWCCSA